MPANQGDLDPRISPRGPVIVASQRAPLSPVRRHAQLEWDRGVGGVAQAVAPALGPGDRWVALAEEGIRLPSELEPGRLTPYAVRYVRAERRALRQFQTAANRALWFALHGLEIAPDLTVTRVIEAWEDGYRKVGETVAGALAEERRRSPAPVLLQDFQLFGAAGPLRRMAPDARIGLFCHTPFPGPEGLRALPHLLVADILRSLLACDLIGFQSERDLSGFSRACAILLGATVRGGALVSGGRTVRLGVFPATVDAVEVRRQAAEADPRVVGLWEDDLVVTWVGRSDPVKDPVGAIRAFRRLMETLPGLQGWARLLMKVQPSRQDLPEYRECLHAVHKEAAEVNAELASDDWVPVALDTSTDRAAAVAALARADVILVNSLADGMNLVAQEGVLASTRDPAVVLSRAAGAFERFADAVVPCHPGDPEEGARALALALALPAEERRRRVEVLRGRILASSPAAWLEAQVRVLGAGAGVGPVAALAEL